MKGSHLIKISLVFILVRFIQLVLVYITPSQFDISSRYQQLISNKHLNHILNQFIHWDAVYFYKSFNKGPTFEHEQVFGPLWWKIIKTIPSNNIDKFVIATIISNILNYITAILIYELTYLRFKTEKKSYLSTIFFILSPQGIFSIVPYSENLSNFFIILGLYLYYNPTQHSSTLTFFKYTFTSILFGLSTLTRSNTIITGVIFLYDFLILQSIYAFISGIILFGSLVLLNYLPYKEFCPQRGEWCLSTIPSIYSYAQGHYWNVGFLKYWTSNNLFNFVIASPMILLIFKSSSSYYSKDRKLAILGGLHLILCCFFIHVQIILRISGFLPLIYWYLSDLIIQGQGQYWILYLMIWIPLQTTLFSSFLPPA